MIFLPFKLGSTTYLFMTLVPLMLNDFPRGLDFLTGCCIFHSLFIPLNNHYLKNYAKNLNRTLAKNVREYFKNEHAQN